ncbi:MAG: DEAD/DEAH box helicase family protein [Planctomycetia bacterium]|nr:DEAD/DEAH box helicase family protein [Planctomycetia bacterium]
MCSGKRTEKARRCYLSPGLVGDKDKNPAGENIRKILAFAIGKVGRRFGKYCRFCKQGKNIDVVIVDEAHRFRNQDTQDYEYLKNICRNKIVILLTATPFNNRPGDILSLLKLFITPKKSSITLENNLVGKFAEFKGVFDRLAYIKNTGFRQMKLKEKKRIIIQRFWRIAGQFNKIKKTVSLSCKTNQRRDRTRHHPP